MRTENEMMNLILQLAKDDDRIRCVYLTGSRANPNVEKDNYQDFDVVFVVTETASFLQEDSWRASLGEIAMMQEPLSSYLGWGEGNDPNECYTWLMLFKDGQRIDLQLHSLQVAKRNFLAESLTVTLLDKDAFLPINEAPSDHHYWIAKPSQAEFLACCNEFWWCLSNVGKGLVRQQLPYALRMYHETSHAELDKMIEWAIGLTYDYQVNTGLWGKYFRDYLSEKDYNHYLKTYASGDVSHIWTAVWMAVEMFQEKARDVAHAFDYPYHQEEETAMICYLKGLKATTEFTESQKSGRGMNDEYPQ